MKTHTCPQKIAARIGLALTALTASAASFADPVSLTGACQVTSVIPGQAKCQLSAQLQDSYVNPAVARKVQIKVNGKLIAQTGNDASTPLSNFASYTYGSVAASCGATYTITAFIARAGSTTYDQVGNLPAIVCPTAP